MESTTTAKIETTTSIQGSTTPCDIGMCHSSNSVLIVKDSYMYHLHGAVVKLTINI